MRLLNRWTGAGLLLVAAFGCVNPGPGGGAIHRWWKGLGPVLPHESFPTDCKMCHVGDSWYQLKDNFRFDHNNDMCYLIAPRRLFGRSSLIRFEP